MKALLAPALLAGALAAQADPVHLGATGPATPVPAGSAFEVSILLEIDRPYHVYTHDSPGLVVPTTVTGGGGSTGVRYLDTEFEQAGHDVFIEVLEETQRVVEGSYRGTARFEVARDAPQGPATAKVTVEYAACDENGCLPPTDQTVQVAFDVGPPGAASADATDEESIQDALDRGDVLQLLWLCVLLAAVSLLTPCVFPMIPITVSFFAKRAESGGSRVRYALAYGAGIVATYSGFGLLMALLLGASSVQDFATSPWTNLAVGALFVFFGLSLMGFYDLQPPAFLRRRAQGVAASAPGYLPVVLMGFVFTVTAFTCTAPIVGSLLPALTTSGSPALVVAGMLTFSAAFALPFVLLAAFPGLLSRLPGAGGWMVTLKATLGFLELVAALKFFSNVDLVWNLELLPRPTLLLLTVALLAALTLYLFGAFRLPHESGARPGRWRLAAAVLLLLVTAFLARGLTGKPLGAWIEAYMPPAGYGLAQGEQETGGVSWLHDLDDGLAEARRTGRNVLIDFTGITCTNCRTVEAGIFPDPRFLEAVQDFVPVKLYTDRRRPPEVAAADKKNQQHMQERFGTVTLPLYVVLAPDGTLLRRWAWEAAFAGPDAVEHFVALLEGTATQQKGTGP